MLDEPSLGLAPFLVAEIFDIVRRINKEEGLSVLLVEQNAVAALEVVSHGYMIEGGRIVMHDSAEAMKQQPRHPGVLPGRPRGPQLPRHQALPAPQALAVMSTPAATFGRLPPANDANHRATGSVASAGIITPDPRAGDAR